MGIIDDVLQANRSFAAGFSSGNQSPSPRRQLAIVACMDARMQIEPMLGLQCGDAHVIRNAGGIVTEDVLRSLIVSHYMLNTREFMIINHTDCGMMGFRDEDLLLRLQRTTGTASLIPSRFHAFSSVEENVREQIQKVRTHPWLPSHIPLRGFVYDVRTGLLKEVDV